MIAAAHAACAVETPTDAEIWDDELRHALAARWEYTAAKCGDVDIPCLDGGDSITIEWPADVDSCPRKCDVLVEVEMGRLGREQEVSLRLDMVFERSGKLYAKYCNA